MTSDILLTFVVLIAAVAFSLSGRFGNPVVITVIAAFILSAGLAPTDVASRLGQQMQCISGVWGRLLRKMGVVATLTIYAPFEGSVQ